MRWPKSDIWKAALVLAGLLVLLVFMVWVPASVNAFGRTSALAAATPQATPTEDATVTALNKEKLAQEVQQLKDQNNPDLLGWLLTNVSILLAIGGGIFAVVRYFSDREAERKRRDEEQQRWLDDRKDEREKRAEERFQAVCVGLGDEKEEAKAGAAIVLRTFLRPGYEQFYTQAFDLAVAHLRLRHLDPDIPEPLTSLSQALVLVFKESFPLARQRVKEFPQFLDASCIQLDNAHLAEADLQQAWLPEASLRNAALRRANFSEAILYKVNLFQAELKQAILTKTNLYKANLVSADLSNARLSQADLRGANFSEADLTGADLRGAILKQANPEAAQSLKNTNLHGVTGLAREQLEACKAKGAIIDEDTTTNSSQPDSVPAPQNHNEQAPSPPLTQVNTPPLSTGGSSTTPAQ